MEASFTLEGSDELSIKLSNLGNDLQMDLLEQAAHVGAQPIINEARVRVRKKSRTLSRSIHSETVEKRPKYVEINIGTDVVYARIHEYGGTIVPKKGKYLTIPVSETAKALVSPRNYSGELAKIGMTLQADGVVHWVLATSVTISAQPYMRPAVENKGQAAMDSIAEALRQMLSTIGKR